MLPLRLRLAHLADRAEAHGRRLAEKAGWPQAWLHEFQIYLAQPRMTPEEFWVRYTLKRMAAEPRLARPLTEPEALDFYQTCDYMLWRNLVHRRHSAWRRVLVTMGHRTGTFLEFGCGTAPVAAWVSRRRPEWVYDLVDLPSPHFQYGLWRVSRHAMTIGGATLAPDAQYDVITALDVFEHLADPLAQAERLVAQVRPGGYLHHNFVGNPLRNDLDLATPEHRDATLAYLADTLALVWETDGYRVSRRR